MQENVQKEEGGVSLLEILRLLLSKIKILILVVIAAAIAGGSFGLWNSWNDLYFGTQVEFYVNPEKPRGTGSEGASQYGVYGAYGRHVMDNMIKLLGSESFTEQLLLNGEALPTITIVGVGEDDPDYPVVTPFGNVLEEGEKWSWLSDKVEAYGIFNAAINTAKTARADANNNLLELEAQTLKKTENLKVQNNVTSLINQEWSKLYPTYTTSSLFSEQACEALLEQAESNPVLAAEVSTLKSYYASWQMAKISVEEAVNEINRLNAVYFEVADKAEAAALELWRATPGYKTALSYYSSAVSYSYLEANADVDDANNLARSFIYVKVSVVGEEKQAFAQIQKTKNVKNFFDVD